MFLFSLPILAPDLNEIVDERQCMDTELEFVAERLKDFREKAKVAKAATDLIELIDKPLLTIAGWHVHADNQGH